MDKLKFEPLVSIIIPCYNQAAYLPETLESILSQTYQNWECIIVNDGSPDNTADIAQNYCKIDSRFNYVYKQNGGLSSARNFGIINSRGNYLQFLDSDDLLTSSKIETQLYVFELNPSCDIAYCEPKFFIVREGHKEFFNKYKPGILPTENFKEFAVLQQVIKHNFNVVSSPIISRGLVNKVGMFDEGLKSNEDWDYWARCAFLGANFFISLDEHATTLIRVADASMSTNYNRMLHSELFVREKIRLFLNLYNGKDKKHLESLSDKYMLKNKIFLYGLRYNLAEITRNIFSLKNNHLPFVIKTIAQFFYFKIVGRN